VVARRGRSLLLPGGGGVAASGCIASTAVAATVYVAGRRGGGGGGGRGRWAFFLSPIPAEPSPRPTAHCGTPTDHQVMQPSLHGVPQLCQLVASGQAHAACVCSTCGLRRMNACLITMSIAETRRDQLSSTRKWATVACHCKNGNLLCVEGSNCVRAVYSPNTD